MAEKICTYTETGSDGYGTNWKTECGSNIRMEAPIEVGISFAPKPNEDGKFCYYCGKEIALKEK